MTTSIQYVSTTIPQGSTATYTTTLHNEAGVVLSSLSALTLTYYDVATQLPINGRLSQNVLNTNHVTFTSGGLVSWVLQPQDTVVFGTQVVSGVLATEEHMAVFTFAYTQAPEAKVGRVQVSLLIDAVLF